MLAGRASTASGGQAAGATASELVHQARHHGRGGLRRRAAPASAQPHRHRTHRPDTRRLGGGRDPAVPAGPGLAGVVGRSGQLVPTPVAQAAGQLQWASYFTLGVLLAGVPLAVVVGLVRTARQLEAARSALAQQAVIRERLRIDGELRQTVGAALEAITVQGDRAGALAGGDPPAAARELEALVGAARRAPAAARRMVTRYQEVSLRAELETTATLLAAAGIQTRLALPPEGLPDHLDPVARARLRRDLARLLRREPAASVGNITLALR